MFMLAGLGGACWDKIVKTVTRLIKLRGFKLACVALLSAQPAHLVQMRPSLWEPSDMDSVTHVVVVKLASRQYIQDLCLAFA